MLGFLIAAFSVIWWAPDVGEKVDPPSSQPLRQGHDGVSLCDVAVRAGVDFHRPAGRRHDPRNWDEGRRVDRAWPPSLPSRSGNTQWAQLKRLADLQSSTHDLLHDAHQHGSEPLSYRLN